MEIRERDGLRYIDTETDGDVLVLLHGLFGALSNFRDVIRHFRSSHRVVFPMLPLYTLPLKDTTVSGMTAYVARLMDRLDIDRFHLLGNSLGGHITLVYALEHSDRVRSIILTGSSGLFENSLGDGYPNKENYDYVRKKTEFTFYDPATATKELVDEVYETVNDRSKAIRIITMAKSAVRHNLRDELHRLTMPAKLIWGRNDTITPLFVGEEFAKLLPNADLSVIDRCGHAAMMERPMEFNAILARFLNEHAS